MDEEALEKSVLKGESLEMSLKQKLLYGGALGFGGLFLILGILALTLMQNIINDTVVNRNHLGFEVANGTRQLNSMTKSWLKPPYDMQIQLWMYNLQNEDDVLKSGAKPKLQEIGPFTFKEIQEKTFHEFSQNYSRILYRNNHIYVFNRNDSCADCDLNRNITIPNVLFQKLVDFAELGFFQKLAIETAIGVEKRETPFITVTVGEALFDGYEDPLIAKACAVPVISAICKGAQIPNRIGFFYGQNNTNDGLYEISTGLTEPWNLGKVSSWNNMTILPESYWDNKEARMINGTDGQLFSPMLKRGDPLTIFAAPACRSVWMEFRHPTTFQEVPAWRYGVPSSMYDPSLPENIGFCNKNGTPEYFSNKTIQIPGCLPSGFLDFGRCQPGQPRVYLSQSHFFNAEPSVRARLEGVSEPTPANDDTYVDIEPISGAPINAKRLMQVNIGMKKGNLKILENTSNIIIPVLWLNETATFDSGTRDQLKNELYKMKNWSSGVGIAFVTLGSVLWMAVFGMILTQQCAERPAEDEVPIISETDNDVVDDLINVE